MKKLSLFIVLSIVSIFNISAQEKLQIDTSKSSLKWSGEYSFYFGGHNGTISFKGGYFEKKNDVISGGEFIIDMNSIICLDIEDDEANEGLIDHLKNDDFFSVSKYPTAKLVINTVDYHDHSKAKIYAT